MHNFPLTSIDRIFANETLRHGKLRIRSIPAGGTLANDQTAVGWSCGYPVTPAGNGKDEDGREAVLIKVFAE